MGPILAVDFGKALFGTFFITKIRQNKVSLQPPPAPASPYVLYRHFVLRHIMGPKEGKLFLHFLVFTNNANSVDRCFLTYSTYARCVSLLFFTQK
jgi:hypothetical protein